MPATYLDNQNQPLNPTRPRACRAHPVAKGTRAPSPPPSSTPPSPAGGDKASGGWPVSFGGAALHSSPVLRACGLVVFDKSRRRPVVDAGIIGTCHASAAAHHACDGPGTGRRWRQARALSCGQEPSPSPSPSPSLLTARSGTFAVVFVCSGRSRTAGGVVSASGTVPHHTRTDNFVTPPTEGSRVECAVFARWRGIIHGWES